MFYLLYYTETMDKKNRYCFNWFTIYVINQNWNVKGLKSKPFKHFFQRPTLFPSNTKLSYMSYVVYCNNRTILTQHNICIGALGQ